MHCLVTIGPDRLDTGLVLLESGIQQGILMHVLWRENCKPGNLAFCLETDLQIDSSLPLSKARNLLLRELFESGKVNDSDVVFLGDDDGVFPLNLKENIDKVFMDINVSWALGRYTPSMTSVNLARFPNYQIDSLSQTQILRMASSLGIYSRIGLMKIVGFFDENIGIGTDVLVGEDTDYVFRLKKASRQAIYYPNLVQFHPYKLSSKDLVVARVKFLAYLKTKDNFFVFPFIRFIISSLIRRRLSFREMWKIICSERSALLK